MSILDRFRTTRLTANPPIPKPDPITPIPETVTLPMCAFCGNPATHKFTNGDLYLKRLPYSYLCEEHWQERESKRTRHNIANHKTEHREAVRVEQA